jgi:exopolysaccharide biosynthesis polyprenyl glycosylphosphotransferase
MWNGTAEARPRTVTAQPSRQKLNWRKLERHLQEVGALHTGIYSLLRNMIPAIVLGAYWLHRNPATLLHDPVWWRTPRISLLELSMLISITLVARIVNGHTWHGQQTLLHRELASSMASALLSGIVLSPCILLRLDAPHALLSVVEFIFGSILLRLLLLAATALIGLSAVDALLPRREVLLVGSGRGARGVFDDLTDSPIYHVAGVLDDSFVGSAPMRDKYLGGLALLDTVLKENPISIVYCSLPLRSMYEDIQRVIEVCERFGVEVRHSSHLFQTSIARLEPGRQKYSILRMVREDSTHYVKRAFDFAAAAALLLISLPFMLPAAIAIKATSKGPIFFSQERYGLHRRRFRILKLRTMVQDAEYLQAQLEHRNELGGPVFKIRSDPRITMVGSLLRKTSIDELPQLWNVLRGEMSLVGPRPLAVRDVLMIDDSSQLRRFSVLPGITCIWQIAGRNNTDFDNWIRQDLEYIDNWSLWMDLKILLGTIPAVLWGRGAM